MGYVGLYGKSGALNKEVQQLAKIIFIDAHNLNQWEIVVTPVISAFFARLVCEQTFSFENRLNE